MHSSSPDRHDLLLKSLRKSDMEEIIPICHRAFRSADIAREIREELEIYFASNLENTHLIEQPRELVPREYYSLTYTSPYPHRLAGLTGLYKLGRWSWSGALWLGWFALDPELHARGLGIAALELTLHTALLRGAHQVSVEAEADSQAARFYQANSFLRTGTLMNHYGPQCHAWIFTRAIR